MSFIAKAFPSSFVAVLKDSEETFMLAEEFHIKNIPITYTVIVPAGIKAGGYPLGLDAETDMHPNSRGTYYIDGKLAGGGGYGAPGLGLAYYDLGLYTQITYNPTLYIPEFYGPPRPGAGGAGWPLGKGGDAITPGIARIPLTQLDDNGNYHAYDAVDEFTGGPSSLRADTGIAGTLGLNDMWADFQGGPLPPLSSYNYYGYFKWALDRADPRCILPGNGGSAIKTNHYIEVITGAAGRLWAGAPGGCHGHWSWQLHRGINLFPVSPPRNPEMGIDAPVPWEFEESMGSGGDLNAAITRGSTVLRDPLFQTEKYNPNAGNPASPHKYIDHRAWPGNAIETEVPFKVNGTLFPNVATPSQPVPLDSSIYFDPFLRGNMGPFFDPGPYRPDTIPW